MDFKRRFRNCYGFLVILLVQTIVSAAETEAVSRLFAVNLSPQQMDLRLGEGEQPIFQKLALPADSVTVLTSVAIFGDFPLFYRASDTETWYTLADSSGKFLLYPIKPGAYLCICLDRKGEINYFSLDVPVDNRPAVCFLNSSVKDIAGMQIGIDWGKQTAASTNRLPALSMSGFRNIEPGSYSLFWQFAAQAETKEFFAYPDAAGSGYENFDFVQNQFYLFLVADNEAQHYAILYKLITD